MYVKEIQEHIEFKGMKQMINKVPMVTLYFWIIKILCIPIGETASDFLNSKLNLALS